MTEEKLDIPADLWKHRSEMMRCHTCMFWVHKQNNDLGEDLGRCRRHAPTLGGFPVVFDVDWCGDHKLESVVLRKGD